MTPPLSAVRQDSVIVEAPARLHLGFMDLSSGVGRRFGSVGLTLESVCTRVCATLADAGRGRRAAECSVCCDRSMCCAR